MPSDQPRAFVCLALLTLLLAAGCSEEPAAAGPKTTGQPLRVARYYWPGMYWIDIAAEKGWFAEEGLNVELVDTNADFYGGLQQVVDGKIDVAEFYLFDLLLFNSRGADLVGFLSGDMDVGATGIAVSRQVGSMSNLRGRTVAVPRGTFVEYLLGVGLEREGLRLADVVRVDLPAEKALEHIARPEVAAVGTWEPLLSDVAASWGVRAFDTGHVPGVGACVFTTRRPLLRQRPADIAAFCRVWKRTSEWIEREPGAAYAIIARIYGTTTRDVAAFTKRDRIRNLRDNLTAFTFTPGFESIHGAAQSVNRYLVGEGIVQRPVDTMQLLDPRFVRALEGEERP